MTEEITKTKPTNYDELYKAVESKEIVAAIRKDGKKDRLFVATNGNLCKFIPKSSRRGVKIYSQDFDNYVKFIEAPAPKTGAEQEAAMEKRIYNDIAKYRRMAMTASFTNEFIESCKKLPASFDEWKKDIVTEEYGKVCLPRVKNLFDYSITTGNKIDGVVISLKRIEKQYKHIVERIREAIKNQTKGNICSRYQFAGYEMSIEAYGDTEWQMSLSLEYKGCGNGYYYLLINDENFIGYDVD